MADGPEPPALPSGAARAELLRLLVDELEDATGRALAAGADGQVIAEVLEARRLEIERRSAPGAAPPGADEERHVDGC